MRNFTSVLLKWFEENKRDFPWRGTADPYKVWVSEIMSHQTQIERVATHFYPRFLKQFPTLGDLAKASWEEVFPVWNGLGYYNRGQNMLKTAQHLVKKYDGYFPRDFEMLQQLPGIGAYTAAAILSFAHDEKIPAIDTNVSRIIRTLWPKENIVEAAKTLIADADSGRAWNSAMMDLACFLRSGKKITPPLDTYFPSEVAEKFIPEKKASKATSTAKKRDKYCVEVGIACIWNKSGKYLIQSRPEGKSFAGHWEFPGGKRERGESFRTCVKREVEEELGIKISVRPHFYDEVCEFRNTNLRLVFHRCQIQAGEPKALENQVIRWASPAEFGDIQFLPTNGGALERLRGMRM